MDYEIENIICDPKSRLGKLQKIAILAQNNYHRVTSELLKVLENGAPISILGSSVTEHESLCESYIQQVKTFISALDTVSWTMSIGNCLQMDCLVHCQLMN